jgi:Iap family predicted aminopeptidase
MIRVLPLFAVALAVGAHAAPPPKTPPKTPAVAAQLAGAALMGGHAFSIVQSLTDRVGHRIAGSPSAERALEWALAEMRAVGLRDVRREPVKVPRWVRGDAELLLDGPTPRALHALALGGSVGTAADGLAAEIIEVSSFEELKAAAPRVAGKIVLFNKPMKRSRGFDGYGSVVGLRARGAVEAARLGAVGALIRSVGTGAFRLPHTGATRYDPQVTPIPYAAVAVEDADLLHRLLAAGEPVRVKLRLGCTQKGEVDSANVVGEIKGREKPDEIVLISAHLDSWDVGAGALDDGAGCAIVLETARLIAALGAAPRRTIRVVLFMNEENGLSGARAYAEAHKAELSRHVAALEADAGAGRPLGFVAVGGDEIVDKLRPLTALLGPLGFGEVTHTEEAGADLIPLQALGVPVLAVSQDMSSYFDWHHTAADTLDKIDPADLSLNVVAFSIITHALADSSLRLPAPPPPPRW